MLSRILSVLPLLFLLISVSIASAAPQKKIDRPPLAEKWFGIYVDNERVGFYRQRTIEIGDGFRMEGDGSVRIKVMGFSKEVATRESYTVSKGLTLRSFEVEQTVNGVSSRVSGKVGGGSIRYKTETAGKSADKSLKVKGDIYPGPALNLYPLLQGASTGSTFKVQTFDPEEQKIKDVKITVLGDEKTPSGEAALKLRNNLYPFVNNDIWIDDLGNTLLESVREGLVTTRAEDPKALGTYISNLAFSKKDLIYDFSLVPVEPPIRNMGKLSGLMLEISGWNDGLPLLQEGGQSVEKSGDGRIIVRTGSLAKLPAEYRSAAPVPAYLKPAEKIESDAPEIAAQAKELATGIQTPEEHARKLVAWTADWLKDTIEDGGGAVASFKTRSGNCQTHARLYTALARSAGIPTRFVSGLTYAEGKGFLYHSWAESFIGDRWIAVDPTYNQLPSDPTHIKLFEGHLPDDLAPIIAIIGQIRIKILESKL
ncbi:MAG TPA: transglutaminase domain-containing protein [Desulfuromonadales bacterium]|nr:transglutaminase domain-containing protein [Desulfuromonadales bacterium]